MFSYDAYLKELWLYYCFVFFPSELIRTCGLESLFQNSIKGIIDSKTWSDSLLFLFSVIESVVNPNRNPFTIPKDNDVFMLRDRERQKKKQVWSFTSLFLYSDCTVAVCNVELEHVQLEKECIIFNFLATFVES